MTVLSTPFLLGIVLAAPNAQVPGTVATAVHDKLQSLQGLTATMVVSFPGTEPQQWKLEFQKPNLYVIIAPDQEYRSDGKVESYYLPISKRYQYSDRKGSQISDAPFAFGFNWFFPGAATPPIESGASAMMDGKPVDAFLIQEPGFSGPTTLYVGSVHPSDSSDQSTFELPLGYAEPIGQNQILKVRYVDIKLNPTLPASDFTWTPPPGAKPIVVQNLDSKMLKDGDIAPSKTVMGIDGAPINLAQEYGSHKTTMLYFWYGLPPYPDLISLKELYSELHDQRFQLIVIDSNASESAIRNALNGQNLPFPVVVDENADLAKAYGVQVPSEYLVGADGKIGSHYIGYDPDGITKALRMRGFRI